MIYLPPVKRFLYSNDILHNLYPNPLTLVVPAGPNTIIKPKSDIFVVYGAGSKPFGGAPGLQVGYPNLLDYSASFPNFPLNQLTSKGNYSGYLNGSPNVSPNLSDFTNKPLVVSLTDGTAAYGPIATSSKASGGTGYAPGDTGVVDPNGDFSTGDGDGYVIDTVSSGVVLTYHIVPTSGVVWGKGGALPYPAVPTAAGGAQAGIGTGFTVNVNSITQGDGFLFIEFEIEVVGIPYPCR